jgi:hypothetical protein
MARLLAASLLFPAALPALVATPPAQAAARQTRCPNPKPTRPTEKPPVYVRVTGVSCSFGYAFARKVMVKAPKGCLEHPAARQVRLSNPCRVAGYRCTSRPIAGGIALEATCRRGAKAVRFQAMY